jgi:predicted permease
VRQTSKSLIQNPIIIGLALGFLANILALPIPQVVATTLDIVAQATLPCSLFVLGGMLTTYKLAGHFAEAGLIITLKLMIQPILVWLLVFPVFHVDPLWGTVAVMAAGMPVGISAYIYSQNYHLGTAALSTAVLLSTILALFSQSIWLYLLT